MLSSKKKLCKQITGEKRELPRSNAAVRYVGNVELNAQVVLMISILCLQRRGGVVFVFQVFCDICCTFCFSALELVAESLSMEWIPLWSIRLSFSGGRTRLMIHLDQAFIKCHLLNLQNGGF